MAKTIMIQGTGSGVGKSIIVTALCRIFLQAGYKVAPFKAQNMALNSYVTATGGEIGRAQATQALACKIRPTVDMNPILIKPTRDTKAQIILHGKPIENMSVYEYKNYKARIFPEIKKSFERLDREYEIIVIEGAGSPAEINLKEHDLVNMKIAQFAKAPVILVGDIDRGGVFAWLIGTLNLLSAEERKMVKGFIINKFRGDKRLLRSGINFLEKYTGIKVLGVIPYFHNIKIPEEDSVSVDYAKKVKETGNQIKICVIYLPHISNFNDFDPLEQEPDVSLTYTRAPTDLENADVIILPGTKNTIEDLNYLKRSGMADKIVSVFKTNSKVTVIGICGGYQMLGEKITDEAGIESPIKSIEGLGLLPMTTQIYTKKILSQIRARDLISKSNIIGYEIHHGRSYIAQKAKPMFEIVYSKTKRKSDGAEVENRRCWGTYIHGVFDNDKFRRYFLNSIRARKKLPMIRKGASYNVDKEIDRLSRLIRRNMNMSLLYEILATGV